MQFRLGYLVPEFPSQTHGFFWREAAAMEAKGVGIQFLSTRRPPADACPHAFAEEARRRTRYLFPPTPAGLLGVRALRPGVLVEILQYIIGLSASSLRDRANIIALTAAAVELAAIVRTENLDHIHVHSCASAAHIAALASIICGVPYSLTVHGDLDVYGKDHAAKFGRASLVSAVTRPLAQQVRAVDARVPTPVVWMGVDTDRFHPKTESAEDGSRGALTVISVARLNYVKGHRYFLEAMARLVGEGHDIRYEIAGDGPHRATIEEEIRTLGLQDRVRMLGSIGEEDVARHLEKSDVFALTSFGLGEAAPVALMEAMACGTPAICSLIGGTGDMIESGETGILVAQKDVDAIAAALRELLVPNRRIEMGSKARRAAIEQFDYRKMASRLLDQIRTHTRPAARLG